MDYAAIRYSMVENQIRTNKVTDSLVIDGLGSLPREAFVPKELRGVAYVDEDISLGRGRFLMEPLVTARVLQAAEITAQDVVLDVGCGTGYMTAAMARMASAIVALESDAELADQASSTLSELGLDTVAVVQGPLQEGYPRQAPYDVIVFGGAVADIPEVLRNQLAEGGRMVAVISGHHALGKGTLFLKVGGIISSRVLFDASTPVLPGFQLRQEFKF